MLLLTYYSSQNASSNHCQVALELFKLRSAKAFGENTCNLITSLPIIHLYLCQ